MRVWNGTQCIQNITLPAISVWSVAVSESGDIVSGSSDRIARVFTRDPSRRADPTVIAQFENAVRESAIPKQQVGNINKEKLPGPDFLKRKAGTKEGQVQMIREDNGTVTAHTWSMATREWIPVGTVVDSAGSSGRKTEYLGQDYDYVFDVDIEDGKPPLKLPYNLSQNPFEAATKFLQDNNLPMGYLDQVANFIIQNTQGATIGQTDEQSQAAPPDPWGQDKRYRPGDAVAAAQAPSATPARQDVLPQKSYLSIKTANLNLVTKKLQELNEQLISSGNKEVSLNPPELETILALCKRLESSGTLPQDVESVEAGISLISKAALKWPPASRLPGVDLLRIVAAATPAAAQIQYDGQDIVSAVKSANLIDPNGNANHSMLAIRLFANLFETAPGRQLAVDSFDTILPLVTSVTSGSPNRNITIAATTLYINYAVYFTTGGRAKSAESAERGLQLVDELSKILGNEKDSEAIYRGLVALGTLVKEIADEVLSAARDVYNLRTILNSVLNSGAGREPRIKGVVEEIRRLL